MELEINLFFKEKYFLICLTEYIPQLTHSMAVSVIIPQQIRASGRGGPWILGWHQEKFEIPKCRLCTNSNQSYTMPVTIYLPDDGWCPEVNIHLSCIFSTQKFSIQQFIYLSKISFEKFFTFLKKIFFKPCFSKLNTFQILLRLSLNSHILCF